MEDEASRLTNAPTKKLTVISGGQTGVDLAALYAAEACSLPISGWVPNDFTNELGAFGIPERFHAYLQETSTTESAERTELNIRDANAILTLYLEEAESCNEAIMRGSKGTQHGIDYAKRLGKTGEQMMFVNLAQDASGLQTEVRRVQDWLSDPKFHNCAIGGPRESEASGIQEKAEAFLLSVFRGMERR